jgi:polyisoprenoid-binding protein YceI
MRIIIAVSVVALLRAVLSLAVAAPLEIDRSQSSIAVSANATGHSFRGTLQAYDAMIEFDSRAGLPSKAAVSFNFVDLKTGNPKRDEAMLEWLEHTDHPIASFLLTRWKQDGKTNMALGELTIHGVKRAIQMPIDIKHEENVWTISGEAQLDHRDFKLPRIRKALLLTVNPQLKVIFHLVGSLPSGD